MTTPVHEIIEIIREQSALKPQPYLVGIDGQGGSGKSYLAQILADELHASVIHGDDFYRDMDEIERWNLTPEQAVSLNFDWERLRSDALIPLSRGHSISYRAFDWEQKRGFSNTLIAVESSQILIVEGVYTCRPELAALFDLRIFVETSLETRVARMKARMHGNERWIPKWTAAEDFYLENVIDRDHIDYVISGVRTF